VTHDQIVAGDVAEAYLAGRLTPAERETFEAHYFECATCFETLQDLQQLRAAVRAEGHTWPDRAPDGLAPRMQRMGGWVAIAASVILAVAAWRARGDVQELRAALNAAQQERSRLESRLSARVPPVAIDAAGINVPVALLEISRAAGEAHRLVRPSSAREVVLWLDAPADLPVARAVVKVAGRAEASFEGLAANDQGAYVMSLPAAGWPAGLYTIELFAAGTGAPIAVYRLDLVAGS
jgi:hypothetical protein